MIDVAVLGAGGHGQDVMSIILDIPKYNFIGFFDDVKKGQDILGTIKDYLDTEDTEYLIGVNDSKVRYRIDQLMWQSNKIAATAIHPLAYIGAYSIIGVGCVLAPGSIVTTQVKVGSHSHINVGATISQNTVIGPYSTISPGANICGDCEIGHLTMIGAGSTVKNLISIGESCVVGAGANVVKDVPSFSTVVGNPARPL